MVVFIGVRLRSLNFAFDDTLIKALLKMHMASSYIFRHCFKNGKMTLFCRIVYSLVPYSCG